MRTKAIILFLLSALPLCGSAARTTQIQVASLRHPNVDWFISLEMGGNNPAPTGTVFVTIDEQRIPVFHSGDWVSQHLISDWWPREGIPTEALTALATHYEKHRDQLYIVRRGDTLVVFHRTFTDGDRRPAFRPIHHIQVNERSGEQIRPGHQP